MINKLWTEKYRPKTIDDYVFVDQQQKQIIQKWITDQMVPNAIFLGDPGTGKTSLVRVLINELNINEYDVLEINASRDNGIDVLRNRISSFASTLPFGKFKIVFLDEFDYASPALQAALRNDMEAYSDTVRFLLTANYEHKIIPAIRESRCTKMQIAKPDVTEFTTRAATVLLNEEIAFDLDVLDNYVSASYPDLRKCLNMLQNNSISGNLELPSGSSSDDEELLVEAAGLFKNGNMLDGRKQLMQFISMYPSRIEDIYKWMYNNLDLWGDTNQQKDAAIIFIRNGLANLPLVGIPEISLAATLAELVSIKE